MLIAPADAWLGTPRPSFLAPRRQQVRELGARADAELPVDVGEMRLDRALAEEERRRHLPVRPPFGDERGNAMLAFGQLPVRRRPAADPRQLGAGLVGPERRAEPLEPRQRVLERSPGIAAALCPPLRPPEREQRPRMLERIGAAGVLGERALEARERALEVTASGVRGARGTAP